MSATYLSKRPCPVCEGCEGVALAQLNYALFDDLKMSGLKTLVQCNTCGMLYDDVNFSDDQLQHYYRCNEHYAACDVGGSGSISEDNKGRYDRIIDLLAPPTNGVILDFGCGQGGFISRCMEHGLEAIGIESSEKSRKIAHEAGIQVYGSVNEFVTNNPNNKVQAVVFSHVLEHLMHPINLIRSIAPYATNSLVYIEVPDADTYLSPTVVHWPEMYFEHLSHFREKNLQDMAVRAGVEIEKEGKIPFSDLQKDTHCRFIAGRFAAERKLPKEPDFADYRFDSISQIPFPSLINTQKENRPLALWGVSQYAMLLIGSCPGLLGRIRRLFDASPAKIGRRIKGILIAKPGELDTLTEDFILLLPNSIHLSKMRSILKSDGFKGTVLKV